MVAVTRPLADSLADAADPQHWLAGLAPQYSPAEFALLEKAFHTARALYQGHRLAHTQEDMFSHAVAAAAIVADLNLLADAVMAALLFAAPDLREDSETWLSQAFNPVVAGLVLGGSRVRKIQELGSQHDAATPEARSRQAEAMRQMLLAMVADIRVVLIKLAWRTQTMYHLSKVPDEAVRRRVAGETLDIFAPLANRLGVWQIKWELEDLAFRHLEPDTYKKIAKLLDARKLPFAQPQILLLTQEPQLRITHSLSSSEVRPFLDTQSLLHLGALMTNSTPSFQQITQTPGQA